MDLFQLVLCSRGREPLLLEPRQRRAALRVTTRVVGRRLCLFGYADDHGHLLVRHPRPSVLAGHLALALGAVPGAPPLQPVHVEPVTERAHLRRLVPYIIRQSEHHGLGPTPLWEGSCFPDLVGARRLEGFDRTAWRAVLPREDERLVWEAAGLAPVRPADVTGQSLPALIAVAARCVGVAQDLRGRHQPVVRARRLVVGLAREAGFPDTAIGHALGCSARNVAYLADQADADDMAAARLALAIDQAVARRASRAA